MILAAAFRAKYGSGFSAYMALQAALLRHYLARGGTVQAWCARLAPAFQERYASQFLPLVELEPSEPPVRPVRLERARDTAGV
jgi:hypothetical protein